MPEAHAQLIHNNSFTTTHAQLRITEIKLLLRSPSDLRLK